MLASIEQPSDEFLSEQRVKRVHGIVSSASDFDQFSHYNRQKYRPVDLADVPEQVMSSVYEAVGKVRTQAFSLDDIYDLYDSARFKFYPSEMVKSMDEAIATGAHAKTQALKDYAVIEDIVSTLSKAPSDSTMTLGMFLKTGKGA